MNFLISGGPLMIFIGLCSIVTIAVGIERWLRLKGGRILPEGFVREVIRLLRERNLSKAIELCSTREEIGINVIREGLNQAGSRREVIREHFENAGREANHKLRKGLGVLATVASISPLLGLMGTVTGMIHVFQKITEERAALGDPSQLSKGISEALITTAAGLAVAIVTLVVHNYLVKKTEEITLELEKASSEILDLLDTDGPLDDGIAA
ncbi:MotA/TolQ/ExbB proton channel family protein [bacterium]|nr:MotA/TolQ/ExbB proton channel family protein [candidate division CSSED10-310 bacterium]